MRALVLVALVGVAHADPAPKAWVDVRAYDMYRCITSWTEVCAGDLLAVHQIEITGDKGMYHCAWGLDEAFAVADPKIQGYAMAIRHVGNELEVKGPNMCFTGEPWEKSVAQGNVKTDTYRFVPLADFEAMRKRAMAIVPNHTCPNAKVRAEPQPTKICLFRADPPPPPKKQP